MATPRISDKKIGDVLLKTKGNITAAAESLGYARSTVWARVEKSEKLKAILHEARESEIDIVEGCLLKQIREGIPASTIFYLKTRGRDRGWTEKIEVDSRIIIENPREVE